MRDFNLRPSGAAFIRIAIAAMNGKDMPFKDFLVDTGATDTSIPKKFLKEWLGYTDDYIEKNRVLLSKAEQPLMANGERADVYKIPITRMNIGEYEIKHDYVLTSDTVNLSFLLGLDILSYFNFKFDFDAKDERSPYGKMYYELRESRAGGFSAAAEPFAHRFSGDIAEIVSKRLHINQHPLVRSKITMLRDKETGSKEFRELVAEIAAFISYEATKDTAIKKKTVQTPVDTAEGWECEQKFGLVPILRAGLGMVDGISNLLPTAKVGHIGIYRDPITLKPVEYYCKLPPEIEERDILLLDPMLATGRTAEASIRYLKEAGAKRIKLLCLVAVREGVEEVLRNHPDVDIHTAAYDSKLNDHGYIVPGLGDAGDRLFGTR